MNHSHMWLRYGISVFTCASAAALAACSSPAPVAPLPGDTPATVTEVTGSAGESPSTVPQVFVTDSAGCMAIVTYTVDSKDQLLPRGLCMRVGSQLLVTNVFPGAVAKPDNHADCFYEAGITSCRLLTAGTVTVTFGEGSNSRSFTVLVLA